MRYLLALMLGLYIQASTSHANSPWDPREKQPVPETEQLESDA